MTETSLLARVLSDRRLPVVLLAVVATAALAALLAAPLHAASQEVRMVEVRMVERGETGAMAFEPARGAAAPGGAIVFVPTDRGHDVASIEGMLPEGVAPFRTAFGRKFRPSVTEAGVHGVERTPHPGTGTSALVPAGAPAALDDATAVRQRGRAADRFEAPCGRVSG